MTDSPRPPADLSARSKRLWVAVLAGFELSPAELELLRSALISLDRADQAAEVVKRDGVVVVDRYGTPKQHPACDVEARNRCLVRPLRRPAWREVGCDAAPAAGSSDRSAPEIGPGSEVALMAIPRVHQLVEEEDADLVWRYRWLGRVFMASEPGTPAAKAAEQIRVKRDRLDRSEVPIAERCELLEGFLAEHGWLDAAEALIDHLRRRRTR